eukprot:6875868-Prymnesium_polylepis.1
MCRNQSVRKWCSTPTAVSRDTRSDDFRACVTRGHALWGLSRVKRRHPCIQPPLESAARSTTASTTARTVQRKKSTLREYNTVVGARGQDEGQGGSSGLYSAKEWRPPAHTCALWAPPTELTCSSCG